MKSSLIIFERDALIYVLIAAVVVFFPVVFAIATQAAQVMR
jgi:hypothetical protein